MRVAVIRIFLLIKLFIIASLFNTATGSHHNEDERLFKAAFIYNFAKFTSWPETATKTDTIKLCTQGTDQLVSDLTRLKGKVIKGKALSVIPLNNIDDCNMLYIASTQKHTYKGTLKNIRNKPILTISEIKNFASSGGIIELHHQKGRTSITANLEAVRSSNLDLSSRLLMLANIIPENDEE